MLGQLGQFAVTPHLKPRDAVDVIAGMPLGLLATVELNIAPVVVIFIVLRWAGVGLELSAVVAFPFYIAIGVLMLLHAVTRLELDAEGIRFVRLLGWPRFIPWSEIDDISPVTRREILLHAWLWPPWPRRESTASLTALGHFRIVFGNHVRYFPPSNPEEFAFQVRNFINEASSLGE
jgi:hypothetical protein